MGEGSDAGRNGKIYTRFLGRRVTREARDRLLTRQQTWHMFCRTMERSNVLSLPEVVGPPHLSAVPSSCSSAARLPTHPPGGHVLEPIRIPSHLSLRLSCPTRGCPKRGRVQLGAFAECTRYATPSGRQATPLGGSMRNRIRPGIPGRCSLALSAHRPTRRPTLDLCAAPSPTRLAKTPVSGARVIVSGDQRCHRDENGRQHTC